VVILPAPIFDDHPRFRQAMKPLSISTFSPKGPIKTLIAAILPGLAGGNATRPDALVLEKRGQILGHQLGPIITPYVPRGTIEHQQASQHLDHALMRECVIHFNGQTEAGGFILHRQTPQGGPGTRGIMDKIPTPHVILLFGRGLEGRARHDFLAGLSDGDLQPTLPPHPVKAFEIHPPAPLP